jgi:uncharacterized protein (TIGR02217 family)
MTTFNEVQFPPSISQGAQGGMGFNTSIISLSSGDEHRNINWIRSRGKWDVKHGLKTQEQIEELIDFFAGCWGRAYGFRFKDWLDYRVPRWTNTPGDLFALPVFFTTNGTTTTFQLTKVYSIGGVANYTRNIQKPCPNTLQLLNNGTQIFSPTDWTVDTTTGIVTLSAAIAATSGHQIGGSCEFDVPCRFDTDDMQATITTTEIYSWDAIPVVEIRDID